MELSRQVLHIRTNWAIGDAKRDAGLTTPDDIIRFDDISYGPYGKENLLDVYVQKGVSEPQPTIVNIHGGGWVYGSKEIYQFYCMSLAQRGFTVVNFNYRLAPESRFPAAIEDVNSVLAFIAENGAQYFADKDRLVLVGDSAGGQLANHYATIYSNPDFASLFDFKVPDITIKAVGLNCGVYDVSKITGDNPDSLFLEYIDAVDKPADPEVLRRTDAVNNITPAYPPAFVMSCVNDFLVDNAEPMYRLLQEKGVTAEKKIYGSKEAKEIAHVFHVNIRLAEATKCNDDECAFFRRFV